MQLLKIRRPRFMERVKVGKSYLIKNLLSEREEPFYLVDPKDGAQYDFLEQINPRGNKTEATSVVTRFSAIVDILNPDYPIKVKLLTPKDIVLILADSYFADVRNYKSKLTPPENKGQD